MLLSIESRQHPTDLVEVLAACHGRIREHLAMAGRIATASGRSDGEVRDCAERVRRYFTIAFPLHIADEEETIRPRLATLGGGVTATLETVADEHALHTPLIEWFLTLIQRIEQRPDQLPATRAMLAQTLELLVPMLELHLELEEQVVFPALRRLPAGEQAEILAAIRRRREPN